MLSFLHFFPPELAHRIAVFFLKIFQKINTRPPQNYAAPAIHIKSFPKVTFCSPVGLAAGFDKNAEVFPALFKLGFGFIEVGTVTALPQKGNEGKRIFRVPSKKALVNRLGFNNCGSERFVQNLNRLRTQAFGLPLWVNIGKGKNSDEPLKDYQFLEKKLLPYADAFVINVSSPNTPGLRDLQSEEFLEGLSGALSFEKPILVKFAPDLPNEAIQSLSEYIRRSRFCGLVLTNTSRKLAAQEGYSEGGFSGEALFNRSRECVALAKNILASEKTIVGVGGISNAVQAQAMKKAGADLVEIYTGFIYQGPKLIQEIASAFGTN